MTSKYREQRRQYYLKNKDSIKAKSASYYAKNKERILERMAKKHKENPEIMRKRVNDNYHNNPEYRAKTKVYSRKWVENNPDERKRHVRRSRIRAYGITPEKYDGMLEEQGNRCAICKGGNRRAMGIDHDHKTGKVRGLLCDSCNISLGHVEKEGFLEKALQYIAKYK